VIIASLVAGMSLNFIGINPIAALYYAATLNGAIAPILMFFIFRIGNDERIMGQFTNSLWVNVFGWVATALMGVGAIALFVLGALGK
jgi:Mn2+/Fe2+ NRAMP family transporter